MAIYDMLYPWQKEIIDKYKPKKAEGLFLDCGIGKTPISLGLAEANKCSKVLVITTNAKAQESPTLKGSWGWWAVKSSMGYHYHNKKSVLVNEPSGLKNEELIMPSTSDIMTINYEALYDRKSEKQQLSMQIIKFLNGCARCPLAIIVDESHKVKNMQSLQTKAVISIIARSISLWRCNTYVYLLTGTPFTVGYEDLYTQLKILGLQMTKGEFLDRFCIRGRIKGLLEWQQPIVGYKNLDLLFKVVHTYALTIESKDVVTLPPQIFIDHALPETKQFDMYVSERYKTKDILAELAERHAVVPEEVADANPQKTAPNPFYRNIAYPDLNWIADTSGSFWMRARQMSIGFQGNSDESKWFDKSRLDAVKDLLGKYPDNYVLFYNYTSEFLELYDICDKLKYNIDVCNGDIKSQYYYNKYSALPDGEKLMPSKNIMLANYASGSTAMNWQEYSKCILFSLPLYKDYEQGIKRISRIGQRSMSTVYHIFYQDNWLDKSMYESLKSAKQYSEDMFASDLKKNN